MSQIEGLSTRGNFRLVQAEGRRFPGLLVQGDTLRSLLEDLQEEAPESVAAERLAEWVAVYEEMMREVGLRLPY